MNFDGLIDILVVVFFCKMKRLDLRCKNVSPNLHASLDDQEEQNSL